MKLFLPIRDLLFSQWALDPPDASTVGQVVNVRAADVERDVNTEVAIHSSLFVRATRCLVEAGGGQEPVGSRTHRIDRGVVLHAEEHYALRLGGGLTDSISARLGHQVS